MPVVAGKHYSYSKKGRMAASQMKRKLTRKVAARTAKKRKGK